MAWSTPLDLYCERTDPSFWAEPVNALTNAAFLIGAAAAFLVWRRHTRRDVPVLLLIVVTVCIAVGSFVFHTIATRGAALFDTIPIAVFVYGYLVLALRRLLNFGPFAAGGILVGFALVAQVPSLMLPAQALNGSTDYLPPLAALAVVGWLARSAPGGSQILWAAGLFAVSLGLRTIDMAVCPAFPLGTHGIWHVLNAGVLYLLLRAVMACGEGARPSPAAGDRPD